jgi:putative membrane protein
MSFMWPVLSGFSLRSEWTGFNFADRRLMPQRFSFAVKKKRKMSLLAQILIGFVALEHLYILYMEMFAWETLGKKTFRGALKDELFAPTKVLAANQGLYNGFLAAGLIWSLLIADPIWAKNVALFFLGCVAVAGAYGGFTAGRRVFFVQSLPALAGIIALLVK